MVFPPSSLPPLARTARRIRLYLALPPCQEDGGASSSDEEGEGSSSDDDDDQEALGIAATRRSAAGYMANLHLRRMQLVRPLRTRRLQVRRRSAAAYMGDPN